MGKLTINDLPSRDQVSTPPTENEVMSWMTCIAMPLLKTYRDGVLMTSKEWEDKFDFQAAIDHLEWLRGLQLTIGMMAEVIGAGVDADD